MADQATESKATDAAEKVGTAAVEAPAQVKMSAPAPAASAEPKAQPAAAKAPAAKTKPTARPAASKKTVKAVSAARPKTARKAKTVKKSAVTAKVAAAARKPVRAGASKTKGAETMNKQTREAVDSGLFAADQFRNVFGDVNERAKAAAERSAKVAEELADLTRGNVEALVASSKIAAKGVEALSQDAAEYSRKAFEEASQALKSFAEVKSATDFFKLQSDFARAAFDNAVAESARLSETALKIAGDVAEPITSRYTVAAERVKTLAA